MTVYAVRIRRLHWSAQRTWNRYQYEPAANPYDNAQMESFIKTLKYEEVYLREYENLKEARYCIGHFLEAVYKRKRLHSALGYRPPEEFEAMLNNQ